MAGLGRHGLAPRDGHRADSGIGHLASPAFDARIRRTRSFMSEYRFPIPLECGLAGVGEVDFKIVVYSRSRATGSDVVGLVATES